jgi:hypothetical protein
LSYGNKIEAAIFKSSLFSWENFVTNVSFPLCISICFSLMSLAISCRKYFERPTAACPLPVAQSQANSLRSTRPARK